MMCTWVGFLIMQYIQQITLLMNDFNQGPIDYLADLMRITRHSTLLENYTTNLLFQ